MKTVVKHGIVYMIRKKRNIQRFIVSGSIKQKKGLPTCY
jgi:hypothetical protein